MSFSFGTPTPATNNTFGGFGTSQAPASNVFGGQPAPATTGFGTSQPATGFGAQPAATTNTGFGGFGTATSTATSTPFGASTGFGASATPSSTGFSFGAASTAPTTATPSFGGFGNTSAAPTSAPSFGGFGATSTATSVPASTGLFGAPAASSSAFGGFGSTAAKPALNLGTSTGSGGLWGAKPATTTSLFGNTTGGFGQPQAQNNEALNRQRNQQVYQLLSQIEQEERAKSMPSITSEDYKPDNVWHSLALLKSWWDPKSPHCRFKYYFYNVVAANEVQLYQKPADQDQKAWDKAQEMNPDRTKLVPALAIGFDDVQKRMDEQHKLSEAHSAKLAELEAILKDIQKKSQLGTVKKLEEYKRRHMQTAQRVIKFLKYTQVLRNKGLSITPDEEAMRARLELIQEQLQRSDQFHGKLSQLWAQLQLIKESGRKYGKIDGVEEWDAVSEENMSGITKILEEQNNGVQHIIQVLETDTIEINKISKAWRGDQKHQF